MHFPRKMWRASLIVCESHSFSALSCVHISNVKAFVNFYAINISSHSVPAIVCSMGFGGEFRHDRIVESPHDHENYQRDYEMRTQSTVVSLYATISKLNAASLTGVQQQQHLI